LITPILNAYVMLLLTIWVIITVPVWMNPLTIFLKNLFVRALLLSKISCD